MPDYQPKVGDRVIIRYDPACPCAYHRLEPKGVDQEMWGTVIKYFEAGEREHVWLVDWDRPLCITDLNLVPLGVPMPVTYSGGDYAAGELIPLRQA
jgi:hypothetical protein